MKRIVSILALVLTGTACLAGVLANTAPIQDTLVSQTLAPGVSRYFASDDALQKAHPSYALASEPGAKGTLGPAPEGGVRPVFGLFEGKQAAWVTLPEGTSMYATGEVPGPLLRNGRRTVCWNTDAYGYGADAKSLYQSHPWVLCVRKDGSSVGLLADTTYRCEVDTGSRKPSDVLFIADGPSFPVIVFEGATPQEVVTKLASMTGRMELPPRWALGFHQCRYSYYPEAAVRDIAKNFRERKIPCDVIWFDIDYMEAFRIFTFDRGYFPDPKKLNADLLSQGFHNVWMIDPGMKSRDDRGPSDRPETALAAEPASVQEARAREVKYFDRLREQGTQASVWVKRADGSNYEGEVWPGWCFFPDYTAPRVRSWWSMLYNDFLSNGVTGVWNDMNEPAVFNVKTKTMPEDNRHEGDPELVCPNGKPQGGEAAKGVHARYHNVFGMQMIHATREGIAAARPDKRPFVLSRANYIGGQRYGASWTGDNTADWAHLEDSVPMALNMGLSGQPFIGPDIGGFAGNGDGALFARWMGVGALLPFSRAHTAKENMHKEPWSFGAQVEETCREAISRRYRLLPYYYTLFHEASVSGLPVARPLFFTDPKDPSLRSEDDAFTLGADVLVVPQLVPDRSRTPVMPGGVWREFEQSADTDLPRLFVRAGAIVPTGPTVQYSDEKPLDPLTLIVALDAGGKADGSLYEDAGDGLGYQKGEFLLTRFHAEQRGDTVVVSIVSSEGSMPRPTRQAIVKVLTDAGVSQGHGSESANITVKLE